MTLNEIKEIQEFYLSRKDCFDSRDYEMQILEGFWKEINWSALSDDEKLEFRKTELRKKHVYKELYSDLVVLYEETVIELIVLLMQFFEDISSVVFDKENMSDEEFVLFRLKNMLYFELLTVQRKMKLKFSGHILYEDIMEPIFDEIEKTPYYEQYELENLRKTYKFVCELFLKRPYEES
ncbi:hypothetical protein [Flavobacterium hungaricum]|uniref:Uncharacterized protein n=1 Tax=Flavobacterium hungaricum TaxID=2082725 RepID=A0ABR9TE08_9FLAO|nr:hypothetical protein [Flavobacterium hungaricum]MBE8723505.1 hypothetical protein [Flavobacterium hungaricum]